MKPNFIRGITRIGNLSLCGHTHTYGHTHFMDRRDLQETREVLALSAYYPFIGITELVNSHSSIKNQVLKIKNLTI